MLDITAIRLVVTALLASLNHRFHRPPATVDVMVIALAIPIAIVARDRFTLDHGLRSGA